MIRLLEADSAIVIKRQKQVDKLTAKQEKLQADIDKATENIAKVEARFEKTRNKYHAKIQALINNARNDETVSDDAIAIASRLFDALMNSPYEEWVADTPEWMNYYSPKWKELERIAWQDFRDACWVEIDPNSNYYGASRQLNEFGSKVMEFCNAIENVLDAYAHALEKKESLLREYQKNEKELNGLQGDLDASKESEEYLNYAPPEFWDFIEQYKKNYCAMMEKEGWKILLQDGRYIKVTKEDSMRSIDMVAKETIYRVSHKAGRINEVSSLRIGNGGRNFDGWYSCEKKDVAVQTVWAGGWNIQPLHTRVLFK